MRGMNRVTLMGHLGLDPVVGETPGGVPFAGVVLRTCEPLKADATQEVGDAVQWHRIVVLGGKANVVAETLRKGAPAVFEGRLRTRRWNDAQGVPREETVVVCEEVHPFFRSGFDEPAPEGLGEEWPDEWAAA